MAEYMTRAVWGSSSTALIYVPFVGTGEAITINREQVFVTPIGGTLTFRCRLTADAAGGSTILSLYRNRNTTLVDSDTENLSAGNPPGVEFSIISAGWTKGDEVTVGINPTTGLSVGYLTVIWSD